MISWIPLFPHKLAGGESCDTFEEASEVMGKVEAEQAGGFADIMPLHQQAFRLIDNVVMDVADSRATCGFVDDVAEVARRIGQLGSAPGDGGQPL